MSQNMYLLLILFPEEFNQTGSVTSCGLVILWCNLSACCLIHSNGFLDTSKKSSLLRTDNFNHVFIRSLAALYLRNKANKPDKQTVQTDCKSSLLPPMVTTSLWWSKCKAITLLISHFLYYVNK